MSARDISGLIQRYVQPLLEYECERLEIPRSFVDGVYGTYPAPFLYSSCCRLLKDGNGSAVQIRLDCTMRSRKLTLMHYWHEMQHAKDYYEGRRPSELRANLYALRRAGESLLRNLGIR